LKTGVITSAKHILVVEDHDDIRHLVRRLLLRAGYQVSEAVHGADGIAQLNQGLLPDLILLDVMMPVMDGFGFSTELRKNLAWKKIPIITMSADTNVACYKERLGARYTIRKPLDISELLTQVATLVT
jgi:CheY-like chemotaxis protein